MIHERNGQPYIVFTYEWQGVTRRFYKRAADPDNVKRKAKDATKAAYFEQKWLELIEQGTDPETRYQSQPAPAVQARTVGELIAAVWPDEQKAYRYPKRWPGYCLTRIKRDFGQKTFDDVTPLTGRRWLRTLADESLAPRSVNRHKEAAQVVWRWAIHAGLVKDNPWAHVPKVHEPPKQKRVLSRADEQKLVEACRDPLWEKKRWHIEAAIIILVDHGLRPEGEFFPMVKSQVDFDKRLITVISHKGKGGAQARRVVPMTARSVPYFRRLVNKAKGARIFPYGSLKSAWGTIRHEAGLDGFWLRWLRDTAQNRWKEQGMHPEDIATLMGHSVALNQVYNSVNLAEARKKMEGGQLVAFLLQADTAKEKAG